MKKRIGVEILLPGPGRQKTYFLTLKKEKSKKMNLERKEILKLAIPPLVKHFDSTTEKAWELLENHNDSLQKLILSREESKTRQRVNKWWRQYHSDFPKLQLGLLKRVSSPAKLPEPTYDQLICLVWLTDMLRAEQFTKKGKKIAERKEPRPRPTLWQRFLRWIKRR